MSVQMYIQFLVEQSAKLGPALDETLAVLGFLMRNSEIKMMNSFLPA